MAVAQQDTRLAVGQASASPSTASMPSAKSIASQASIRFNRSFDGCTMCKRQKKKCDERRPSCSRCVHSKRECVYVPRAAKLFVPGQAECEATEASPETRMGLHIQHPIETLARKALLHGDSSFEYRGGSVDVAGPAVALYTLRDTKFRPLHSACQAYSLIVLATNTKDQTIVLKANQMYLQCLQDFGQQLSSPDNATGEEFLATAILMFWFEICPPHGTYTGLDRHVRGLRVLLETLPLRKFRLHKPESVQLITAAKDMIILHSFNDGSTIPDYRTSPIWNPLTLPAKAETERTLDAVLVDTVRWSSEIGRWHQKRPEGKAEEEKALHLLTQGETLLSRHTAWESTLAGEWLPRTMDVVGTVHCPGQKMLRWYLTPAIAVKHILFQLSKLYTAIGLFKCFGTINNLPRARRGIKYIEERMRNCCATFDGVTDDIISSVAYFTGNFLEDGSYQDGFHSTLGSSSVVLSAALFTLLRLETVSLEKALWVTDMVRNIGVQLAMPPKVLIDQGMSAGLLSHRPVPHREQCNTRYASAGLSLA